MPEDSASSLKGDAQEVAINQFVDWITTGRDDPRAHLSSEEYYDIISDGMFAEKPASVQRITWFEALATKWGCSLQGVYDCYHAALTRIMRDPRLMMPYLLGRFVDLSREPGMPGIKGTQLLGEFVTKAEPLLPELTHAERVQQWRAMLQRPDAALKEALSGPAPDSPKALLKE